jgi:hypothetical protein
MRSAVGNEHSTQQSVQAFLIKQDNAHNFSSSSSSGGWLLTDHSAIIHTAYIQRLTINSTEKKLQNRKDIYHTLLQYRMFHKDLTDLKYLHVLSSFKFPGKLWFYFPPQNGAASAS